MQPISWALQKKIVWLKLNDIKVNIKTLIVKEKYPKYCSSRTGFVKLKGHPELFNYRAVKPIKALSFSAKSFSKMIKIFKKHFMF